MAPSESERRSDSPRGTGAEERPWEHEPGGSFYGAAVRKVAAEMALALGTDESTQGSTQPIDDFKLTGAPSLWRPPFRIERHDQAFDSFQKVGGAMKDGNQDPHPMIFDEVFGPPPGRGRNWSVERKHHAVGVTEVKVNNPEIHSRLAPLYALNAALETADLPKDVTAVVAVTRERVATSKSVPTNGAEQVKFRKSGYEWNSPEERGGKCDSLMIELYISVQVDESRGDLFPIFFTPMRTGEGSDLESVSSSVRRLTQTVAKVEGLQLSGLVIVGMLPLGPPLPRAMGFTELTKAFLDQDHRSIMTKHPLAGGNMLASDPQEARLLLDHLEIDEIPNECILAIDASREDPIVTTRRTDIHRNGPSAAKRQAARDRLEAEARDLVTLRLGTSVVSRFDEVGHPAAFQRNLAPATREGIMHMMLAGHVARKAERLLTPPR